MFFITWLTSPQFVKKAFEALNPGQQSMVLQLGKQFLLIHYGKTSNYAISARWKLTRKQVNFKAAAPINAEKKLSDNSLEYIVRLYITCTTIGCSVTINFQLLDSILTRLSLLYKPCHLVLPAFDKYISWKDWVRIVYKCNKAWSQQGRVTFNVPQPSLI